MSPTTAPGVPQDRPSAAVVTQKPAPRDYGPQQFPDRLGLTLWQFERALRDGLIPPADVGGKRWSAAVVDAAQQQLEEIRTAAGTMPDVGATRAADFLAERFDVPVDAETVIELARTDQIPCTGWYKDHPLYDGRALERFTDRAALERAQVAGRLFTRDEAAEYLAVRVCDLEHLRRSGWLEPARWVRSGWQRRRDAPAVPLFRRGDLDVILHHPAIDWDAVRSTPRGRPSPLARLTTHTGAGGE